jgi:Rrf2 family protein
MFSLPTEYALSAMTHLAGLYPTSCLVPSIAEGTAVTVPNMHKIVTALQHACLVEVRRGRSGGAKLSRKPQTISFLDIVNAVGPSRFAA